MILNVLLALMLIVSFLGAVALHEWAHATMAFLLGDRTPRGEGRQTLSLRAHLDPVGTLMSVILAFQPIGIPPAGFGWGKPVKPDPWKMRVGPNIGVLLVACAGPIFSLLVGVLTTVVLRFLLPVLPANFLIGRLEQLLIVFASVNITLALFNLIPLYPLDGYQILYTLLPSKQAVQFARSATYGPFIILALFFFLPFLAHLAQVDTFPLFQLAHYIWLGSMSLIGPILGLPVDYIADFYKH